MRRFFGFAALILGLAATANADVIGESPLGVGGSVDGWSGLTVMDGYGSIPAGQSVSAFSFYTEPGRDAGTHSVQPLVIKNEGGAHSIWAVGPATVAGVGENTGAWSTDAIPADGNDYYAGFWQWNDGVNNDAGGAVSFAASGGSGMFQEDEDGTSYVPAIGDEVVGGHSSGEGGRAYQFNLTTVPEPTSIVLVVLAGLGCTWFVRRK